MVSTSPATWASSPRGQYWTDTDTAETPISPERLAAYCGTQHPVALAQLDRWMQEAPTDNSLDLLDRFYVEQRLGCWGSLISHAEYYGPGFWVGPMDHREIVLLMMSLPERDRREGTLLKEIMRQQWPGLLDWPFNTTPWQVRANRLPGRIAKRRARLPSRNPQARGRPLPVDPLSDYRVRMGALAGAAVPAE